MKVKNAYMRQFRVVVVAADFGVEAILNAGIGALAFTIVAVGRIVTGLRLVQRAAVDR